MPRVGQEPSAQDPAASLSSDALRGDVGVEGDAAEIIPSEDDAEAVELEHPDLMAESDARHKKGTFKDPLNHCNVVLACHLKTHSTDLSTITARIYNETFFWNSKPIR